MLKDKNKSEQVVKREEGQPVIPQAVPVIDTTDIQERLKEAAAEERAKELRERIEKEKRAARRCGCW